MSTLNIDDLRKEVVFTAVRSRGPGGQNVNKVSSAALLTWDFQSSGLLTWEQKGRLQLKLANIINSENQFYIRSDEYRDLERNKTRSLEKLIARINEALFIQKKRKPTKPTRASKVRRVEGKKKRSETKKMRGKVPY